MLRTRLLTATAAIALFATGSAYAQTMAPAPTNPTPVAPTQSAPQATPVAPSTTPAQAAQATTPAATNTVVDVLRAQGQFTTLLAALDAAQLTDTLNTSPAISIFAPTDAAFAALPEAERTRLLDPANANELRQLLLYHVVVADVNSSQIDGAKGGVQTAATTEVQLDGTGDAIKVDAATVTTADLDASNGAVFIIDQVLNPATSMVATGDAVPADDSASSTEDAPEATPPVDSDDAATAADDGVTDESMGEDTDTDVTTEDTGVTPPATTGTERSPGVTRAPNGQPAASTTTTASPPVANPTDGQVDDADADEDETDTAAPKPQS